MNFSKNAQTNFENSFSKLGGYIKKYDTLYLCSFCSSYFARQIEGFDEEAINGHLDFPPFYIEILQCISLMYGQNLSAEPLHDKIIDFKSEITKLCKSQSYTFFNLMENVRSQDDIDKIMLRIQTINEEHQKK